jgi:hypothetical protein
MDIKLLEEAQGLAQRINIARFAGEIPSSHDTVRLCEILDQVEAYARLILEVTQ